MRTSRTLANVWCAVGAMAAASAAGAQCSDAWEAVPSADAGPRYAHTMCFDSWRGVMVTFGGIYNYGTQEYDGVSWVTRSPANSPPTVNNQAMAFDSHRGVTVQYGHIATISTWEWDGNNWTERAIPGPGVRVYHDMVYDSQRQVCVLYGGFDGSAVLSDTWEYDGVAWTQRQVTGPGPRNAYALAYDQDRGVTVLFSGSQVDNGPLLGDTWEWDGTSWTKVADGETVNVPSPRMVFDSLRKRIVRYDGGFAAGSPSETYEFDGTSWTAAAPVEPLHRYSYALAYDSLRHKTVLFGGHDQSGLRGDTWEYAGGLRATIHSQPADQTVDLGQQALLTVIASAPQPISYQWKRGLVNVQNGGRISGAKTATLTINNSEPSDDGDYTVVLSGQGLCTATSDTATVLVICPSDFNRDGFVDPLDYNAYINAFETADMAADFNQDGFLDPLDYNGYINAFEAGC